MAVTIYPEKGDVFVDACGNTITVTETVDTWDITDNFGLENYPVSVESDTGRERTIYLDHFGSIWQKKSEEEINAELMESQNIEKGDLIQTTKGPLVVHSLVESRGYYSCAESDKSETVYGRVSITASDVEGDNPVTVDQ